MADIITRDILCNKVLSKNCRYFIKHVLCNNVSKFYLILLSKYLVTMLINYSLLTLLSNMITKQLYNAHMSSTIGLFFLYTQKTIFTQLLNVRMLLYKPAFACFIINP